MHHELTVWSRGIIMDKEARDVSTCIAAAARNLGYYAENVSDYPLLQGLSGLRARMPDRRAGEVPEVDFDEPDAVVRMETAFAPYEGAHAEQAPFTRQLIEDAIADYDQAHNSRGASS